MPAKPKARTTRGAKARATAAAAEELIIERGEGDGMPKILTIAGSDSGGGAGIQADIKTITLLGGYAASVVTAITVQNTLGVHDVFPVPADFVAMQLESVLSDIKPDVVKIGMLANAEITHVVAEGLRRYRNSRGLTLIVDPVIYSKSGRVLLEEKAHGVLLNEIFPLATVVTPNLAEASEFSGVDVDSTGSMHEAAEKIFELGPKFVLVKGGHLAQDAIDVLYDGKQFKEYYAPRIATAHTHGTGCVYASAIATFVAFGDDVPTAVAAAKEFITAAIESAVRVGAGVSPVNPYGALVTAGEEA